MNVIFAGTPEFARTALAQLHGSGHTMALVLTQPDRPAGRGMKLQASPVKQLALQHNWPIAQPRSLRLDGKYPEDAAQARLAIAQARADVMVVAAYGLILPQWVLDDLRLHGLGCLNIHASLLPRWRGAAPIHRAIEAGDTHTGVTIMQMDAGLDTGDMLLVHSLDIVPQDTTASLHDRLASMGGELIVQALDLAAAGRLAPRPQPESGVTYAHKIEKAEAWIDWSQDAASIVRRVRAFNPFPVAVTSLMGEPLKVWDAHVLDRTSIAADAPAPVCGQIIASDTHGIVVAARDSAVVLTELQRPGGKRVATADFLHGSAIEVGTLLGQRDAGAA